MEKELVIAGIAMIGVVISTRLDKLLKFNSYGLVIRIIGILASLSLIMIIPSDEQSLYRTGNYFGMMLLPGLVIIWLLNKRDKKTG